MTENVVRLILLGEPRTIRAEELEPAKSSVTGRSRRRIRFTTTIKGEENNDRLLSEISDARNKKTPISGEDGSVWRTHQSSYSYREDDGSRYSHVVELEEVEQLDLSAVRIGDIEMLPDRWRVDSSDEECFMVIFTSTLVATESEKLEDFIDSHSFSSKNVYFEANFDGNFDSPISVRFGQCLWQSMEDGSVRHQIVLVSEAGDDDGFHGILQPERARVAEHAVNTAARLDALIEELVRIGRLSQDAAVKIGAVTAPRRAQREFDRADDVDKFFD